jgi:hypothetical protein
VEWSLRPETIDDQQDYMAFSEAATLNGKIKMDLGPFNINLNRAMAMAAKHGIGSGDINLVAQDLVFAGSAIPYASAYMEDVKRALDPYLSGVSFDNRIGEYIQGWREGYDNRISRYSPRVAPVHGMANFADKLSDIGRIMYPSH